MPMPLHKATLSDCPGIRARDVRESGHRVDMHGMAAMGRITGIPPNGFPSPKYSVARSR